MNNLGVELVDPWTVLYALRTIARSESGMSKELPVECILRAVDAAAGLGSQWQGKYLPLIGRAVSRDVRHLTELQAAVAEAHQGV